MITRRCVGTFPGAKLRLLVLALSFAIASCDSSTEEPPNPPPPPEPSFPVQITHSESITHGHCLSINTEPVPDAVSAEDAEFSVTVEDTTLALFTSDDCSGTSQNSFAQPYPSQFSVLIHLPLPLEGARSTQTLLWHSGETTAETSLQIQDRAARITMGNAFACAQTESGYLQCWGNNSRAQLGAGNTFFGDYKNSPISATAVEAALTDDSILALGDSTACLTDSSRRVSCWGNDFLDNPLTRTAPVAVSGLPTGIIDLSTDVDGACAVRMSGQVHCWGPNAEGASEAIADVSGAISVRKKSNHHCALLDTGAVSCWGNNQSAQSAPESEDLVITTPTSVALGQAAIALEIGARFSCALLEDGSVKCWGIIGSAAALRTPTTVAFSQEAEQLVAGANFLCARLTNDRVECAGGNALGQLGNGTSAEAPVSAPVQVMLPAGPVDFIAAGGLTDDNAAACAIIRGDAHCWGSNRLGQVGTADVRQGPFSTPLQVQGLPSGVTQVAVNQSHMNATTCLLHAGRVSCFGSNRSGQLGRGVAPETLARDFQAAEVQGLTNATQIQLGFGYACALQQNGGVSCWGNNEGGQLGDGTTVSRNSPVSVVGLAGPASHLSTGNRHTCAVVQGGVQCWGWDTMGQLGDGIANDDLLSSAPVWVNGLGANSGATAVAAGEDYTCAIVRGGAQCWGKSHLGLLGNGVMGQRRTETYRGDFSNTPVNVSSFTPGSASDSLVSIDAGMSSVCALSMSGRVYCWGERGLLGLTDPTVYMGRPVTPEGLESGVSLVAAGGGHQCVIRNSSLLCWGINLRGQLGLGHTQFTDLPSTVSWSGSSSIQSIATGGVGFLGYTCAVTSSGTSCWGDNGEQQLGRDVPLFERLPLPLARWE